MESLHTCDVTMHYTVWGTCEHLALQFSQLCIHLHCLSSEGAKVQLSWAKYTCTWMLPWKAWLLLFLLHCTLYIDIANLSMLSDLSVCVSIYKSNIQQSMPSNVHCMQGPSAEHCSPDGAAFLFKTGCHRLPKSHYLFQCISLLFVYMYTTSNVVIRMFAMDKFGMDTGIKLAHSLNPVY